MCITSVEALKCSIVYFLGENIGHIFNETKKSPTYFVNEFNI